MRVYGRRRRGLGRRALLIPVAIVVVVGAAVGTNALRLSGHVASGISSSGVDLGGLSKARATDVLGRELSRRLEQPIRVRVNGRSARVVPADLGIRIDAAATVRQAMKLGRLRASLFPFGYHSTVDPVLLLPKQFAVPSGLQAAAIEPVDASLTLLRNGTATVKPGRSGRAFVAKPSLRAIALASIAGDKEVRIARRSEPAAITTEAAERARARVARMLSAPITVTRQGGTGGLLQPSQLAPLLTSKTYKHTIGVTFDPSLVRTYLNRIYRSALRTPKDATFADFPDGSVKVVTSHSGISLNATLTAHHLTVASLHGTASSRTARIAFRLQHASFTTKQARALGITQVVASATTDMGVSSPNRVFNVHLMADFLNGYKIAPGARFSFNQAVGPRTADRGFLEGQAIENGLLVPSIGGGVCQVATTVFDAAINGGYEVNERHNHSFYIDHYPTGLDATVADGGPDFAFTNNTGHTVVVKTSYTDQTLTVQLLSAPIHRTVTISDPVPTNYVDPGKRYVADPVNTPAHKLSQQTLGERGFDVDRTLTVKNDAGQVIATYTFHSHYIPEDIVYNVGKGAKLPKGATLEPPPVPSAT
jgi:vancomycin resistance protein YoaR